MLPGEMIGFLGSLQHVKDLLGNIRWILVRDFNLIKERGEKKGGVRRQESISSSFQETMQVLRVEDVDLVNGSFT